MTPTEQAARWLADEPCFDLLQTRPIATMQQEVSGEWMRYDDALAAIARHLAPEDDLVEQATAALEGVTEGPWETFIYDAGGKWTGWPLSISAVNFTDKNIVRPGGCWPYEWDAGTSQDEAVANARFIAFTRQWVPEAAARIAALTATVAEQDALDAAWCERVAAITAEAATLRARLARMEGALEKAANRLDWAAGIIESDKARNQVGEWADEARAALTDGGSNG